MGAWKDIAIQYVDFLVATEQIKPEDWNETLIGILDGDIGISKAWLVTEIYDGDLVTMEAECGTMVRKRAEIFEANYNPNQARDSKGRWVKVDPPEENFDFNPITPEEMDEEYHDYLLSTYEEMQLADAIGEGVELSHHQDIPPMSDMLPDRGMTAQDVFEFISTAANDEDFPERYLTDMEFQEGVSQLVASISPEVLSDAMEMFGDLEQLASLSSDPHLHGFVRRAQIVTQLMLDIKKQQTDWAAETFEAMTVFPPNEGDIADAEALVKSKHSGIGNIKSTYLIHTEGTSNKFHVFMETNLGYFNVSGRIGYPGKLAGPMTYNKYHQKMMKKLRDGYQVHTF